MKKIIIALMVFAGIASADGFVVGTELTYGKVDSDITLSVPGTSASVSSDTKSVGFAIKGGYQVENIRLMGVLTSEKYSDDVVVLGEGNAVSIGAELDYMVENVFIGVTLATGTKDFNAVDIDFTDVGLRVGAAIDINPDINLEGGVQYKKRSYDSYNYSGVDIGLDEKIIGIFIGLNFNL